MDVFAAIKLYKRYQIAQSISNILLWQTHLKAKDKKLTVNKEFFWRVDFFAICYTILEWFWNFNCLFFKKDYGNTASLKMIHSCFFIRTSKFCLRLAVLNFFHSWGWSVLNLFLFPLLNLIMPQRMSDWVQQKHTILFLSFFFFQAAHIGSHWEVFYKKAVLQLC